MELIVSSKYQIDMEEAIQNIAIDYEAEEPYYTNTLRNVGNTIQNGGFPQETIVLRDILKELLSAEEIHCEIPFCYKEDRTTKIWHGVMDVLYKKDGKWLIIGL